MGGSDQTSLIINITFLLFCFWNSWHTNLDLSSSVVLDHWFFKGVKKEHNPDGLLVVYFRTWLHPDASNQAKKKKRSRFHGEVFIILHRWVYIIRSEGSKNQSRWPSRDDYIHHINRFYTCRLYAGWCGDTKGTTMQKWHNNTHSHTHAHTHASQWRSSRTSNTSEIKPSPGWDHQVISQQVNLEKQCPPPPTSVIIRLW